jgi:hypothetical protein
MPLSPSARADAAAAATSRIAARSTQQAPSRRRAIALSKVAYSAALLIYH